MSTEPDTPTPHLHVVGAVIIRDGLVVAAQRGRGMALSGMWEFPGGKVEPGESPQAALVREIDEELGCTITVGGQVALTTHQYEFGVVTLETYYATITNGTPTATEHAEVRWMPVTQLIALNWAPADVPAMRAVMDAAGGDSARST